MKYHGGVLMWSNEGEVANLVNISFIQGWGKTPQALSVARTSAQFFVDFYQYSTLSYQITNHTKFQ